MIAAILRPPTPESKIATLAGLDVITSTTKMPQLNVR